MGDKSAFQMATLKRKEADGTLAAKRDIKLKNTEEEIQQKKCEESEFLNEFEENYDDFSEDFVVKSVDDSLKKSIQNRKNFPTVAAVSMRYGISNRATAAIATAALIDCGLVTEEDSVKILDHNKVHREKQKLMDTLQASADEKYREEDIKCIFFDGRKNVTNVLEIDEATGKYYQSRVKMEHIVVVSEPGGSTYFILYLKKLQKRKSQLNKLLTGLLNGLSSMMLGAL